MSDSVRDSFYLLLTSLVTSLLLLLSMPGRFGWWPLLFIALVPLLSFIRKKGPRVSFSAGLVTGFLYHAGMLYWIVIVLGRYGGLPPFISVPALLLLSLYMALYTALFASILSWLSGQPEKGVPLPLFLFAAPALWVGLDWLRSVLFSGFPWMDIGYGLFSQPYLLQVADLGGHDLVTFLLVLVNVLVLILISALRPATDRTTSRYVRTTIITAAAILLLASCYSVFRYRQMSQVTEAAPVLKVAVVQGNIPQDEKWTPARKFSTLDLYQGLSEKAVPADDATLVVWPETALPFFPVNDPLFKTVTGWAAARHIWLLTGAPFFVLNDDLDRTFAQAASYYNSALLVDPAGEVRGRYDKQHLVPFGEYVPLRKLLPFLEPLVESVGNFSFGSSEPPLSMDGVKLGVLICYESIFPALARKEAAQGANVLVNITNDAWYGRSSAPYQSFAMSVLRAVENRRSLVRAANTGISGFVDPLGGVQAQTPIFETLSLASTVPVIKERTFFVRFGYRFAPACLLLFAILVVFRLRKNRQGDIDDPHFFP